MPLIKKDMTNDEACDALAGDDANVSGLFGALISGLDSDSARKFLELCDKYSVTGDSANRFCENVCGKDLRLFRLIVMLEAHGVRKFDLAKNVSDKNGRQKLKQTVQKDPFIQALTKTVLPD